MYDLVVAMMAFASVVRPYMGAKVRKVLSSARLTERDLDILDFVSKRGQVRFGDILKQFQEDSQRGTSKSRLSAAVSALFGKHSMLKKDVDRADQRQLIITVAPKGRRLLERVNAIREQVYREIREAMQLDSDEERGIAKVFEQATENLRGSVMNQRQAKTKELE